MSLNETLHARFHYHDNAVRRDESKNGSSQILWLWKVGAFAKRVVKAIVRDPCVQLFT